ncbi:MAG: hypothetical protein M1837_006509 [Sclerophora amabilis]|nr:MAG: hypothetical protein M1837_006509 [Sclerophora amabilis]
MIAAKDQCEESAQCKAIQKNILHKKPVVIILGEEHRKAPSQPVAPYSVLGWFKPTHVWIEKDDRHYFYKYRFEKYNLNEISWWVPKDQQPTIPMEERPAPDVKVCPSCEQPSPGIYSEAWVCLNEICEDFWVPEHGICAEDLTYSPNFLQQSTPWPGWEVPYPIKPEFVFDDAGVYDTSIAARKGFVCPECSMCNSRTHWSTLVCSNVEGGCTFTRNVTPNVVNPKSLADPNRLVGVGHTDPLNTMDKDKVSAVVERSPEPVDGFRVHTYDIEGCGQIVHFISNNNINRRKGGADDMFHDMQTADVGLERRKMPSNKMKGSSYTNQFSLNFGMHYEYYVDVPSRSFDDSCDAIRSARTALNWAGRYVVGNQHFHEFNELLALGYFERQRMNYHDDGETGLGPTIATLSLGYPATMTLRMKSKYYTGFTKGGAYYTASPPIPGSIKYEERKEAHAMLDGVRSQAERQKIGEKILKKLQLDNKRRNCPPLVTMNLRHGDIVIMHGFNLQKYYEHAVESQETIRFALTCRYVDPRSVKPELRPRPDVADSGIDPIAVDVNDTNFEHLAMLPTPTETAPDDSEELAASSDSSELSSVMSVEDVDFSD